MAITWRKDIERTTKKAIFECREAKRDTATFTKLDSGYYHISFRKCPLIWKYTEGQDNILDAGEISLWPK